MCECMCVYLATPRQFGLRLILSLLLSMAFARVCVCGWVSLSVIIAAPLTRFGCTMGRMHCDSEPLKIGTLVMSHSLIRSLVRLHRSLTRLLRTARFILLPSLARCCIHSFARSLTHSLPSSWGSGTFMSGFLSVLDHGGAAMGLLSLEDG